MLTPLEALDVLERGRDSRPPTQSSGLTEVDEVTRGFAPGQVWIITGSPGQGRSTLITQWAFLLAGQHRRATHLVSPRDPVTRVASRLVACAGKVPMTHLWKQDLSEGDHQGITRARNVLGTTPLRIAGPGALSIMDSDAFAERWPEVLVIDDADRAAGSSPSRIAAFAARGVEVILVLPRDLVLSEGGVDAGWAGAADFVIDIHRPDSVDPASLRPGEVDLHILRNRWGPQRCVTVGFQAHFARFVDLGG